MQPIVLDIPATDQNFTEEEYLLGNPDVAAAVRKGEMPSGRFHFDTFGIRERRCLRVARDITPLQAEKIRRVEPLLNLEMSHVRQGVKYNFLTEELRKETGIASTEAVSAHGYDVHVRALIEEKREGLILDCGAGRRPIYYSNVVNYEIVDYDTTDIIGVGEALPFKDNSFDGVISIAVLEHVRDPFTCAAEIARVLKPGGKLVCSVPFLQPEHGYPHHYYNMAPQGIRALFDRTLQIDDHKVTEAILPIWTLTWFLQSWANGLQGATREEFLSLRFKDVLNSPPGLLEKSWVKELPKAKNFELACATLLLAHKPAN